MAYPSISSALSGNNSPSASLSASTSPSSNSKHYGYGNSINSSRPQASRNDSSSAVQSQTRSLLDQMLSANSQNKIKKQKQVPIYRNVYVQSPKLTPFTSLLSLNNIASDTEGKQKLPYQSRVSFDTVNINVSPSTGVDPEKNPEYYGLDSNSISSFGWKKVSELYDRTPELSRMELASLTDAQYKKYLSDQKKRREDAIAMHNQVCCYSKMHKDFNRIYHNLNDIDRRNPADTETKLLPVFPRRTVLVYISGRQHTWVALDWAIRQLLVNGDHIVVVCSIFPELADKLHLKNGARSPNYSNYDSNSTNSNVITSTNELSMPSQRTNRFQNDYSSRSRSSGRSRSRSNMRDIQEGFPANLDDLDVRQKAKNIMKYILNIADPNLIIKITIDLSIGTTKDVLKDSYVLYTPSLLVCSAKPREDSAPMRSWKSSRLTDRVVKNFTIPVIIVPALNMGPFEQRLFENLSKQLFPLAQADSLREGRDLGNNSVRASAGDPSQSAPPSISNINITVNDDSEPIATANTTGPSGGSGRGPLPNATINTNATATSSSLEIPTFDSVLESANSTNTGSGTPLDVNSLTTGDQFSEASDDSDYSASSESGSDSESDSESDSDPELQGTGGDVDGSRPARRRGADKVSTTGYNIATGDAPHLNRNPSSKRGSNSRPKLLRLKTLINDLNYENEPDLSTKEKISNFVRKQEKKLSENLKKIPIELEQESVENINKPALFDPNYFKNQLELVSAGSLYITRKLKSLDFSEDKEGAELVRSITGDPALLQPRKFKSMLLTDSSNSSINTSNNTKNLNKRIPASELNLRSRQQSGGHNYGSGPRKASSIKFANEPKKSSSISAASSSNHNSNGAARSESSGQNPERPKLETAISAPDIYFSNNNINNRNSNSKRSNLHKSRSNTLARSFFKHLHHRGSDSTDDADDDLTRTGGSKSPRTISPERNNNGGGKSGKKGGGFLNAFKKGSTSRSHSRDEAPSSSKDDKKQKRKSFLGKLL